MDSMMTALATAKDLTVVGGLLTVIVGGWRGIWVWGWQYRVLQIERDTWRDLALKGAGLADRAVRFARTEAGQPPLPYRRRATDLEPTP